MLFTKNTESMLLFHGAQVNQYMILNTTNAQGKRNLQTRSIDFAVCSVNGGKKLSQASGGTP